MFIKIANGELIAVDYIKRVYIDPDHRIEQAAKTKFRLMAQGPAISERGVYNQYVLVQGTLEEIQKAKGVFEKQIFTVIEYLPDKVAWRTI